MPITMVDCYDCNHKEVCGARKEMDKIEVEYKWAGVQVMPRNCKKFDNTVIR
jgi:hypothetical protein